MATLTSQQLKDSYQSLVTIGDSITSDPTSGRLENGKGTALTAVGIGTDSPDATLDLDNSSSGNIQRALVLSNPNTTVPGTGTEIYFSCVSGNDRGSFIKSASTTTLNDTYLSFGTNASGSDATERMRIKSGGDIYFRNTSNDEAFYWDASASRLGIGITSPSANVHLRNTGASSFFLDTTTASDTDNRIASLRNSGGAYSSLLYDANTHKFRIGTSEKMRIDSSGNVGIGTTSPSALLDVDGDAVINGLTVGRGLAGGITSTAVGNSALNSNTSGANNTALGASALANNTSGSGNIGFGFKNNLGSYAPVFDPSTESNRLVAGHTAITNAYVQVAWTVVSDARDKTNIEDVELGLDFVSKLSPKQFQFKKSRENETPNGKKRYGFLAQDILELEGDNPVIIDNEDEDKLKYNGESLVPILVNAIKELKAEIEQLKAQ